MLEALNAALLAPFTEFTFMSRALFGSIFVSLAAGPLGVFLILRRMSLMADSMSHAILPGVALAFLVAGVSMTAMLIGGLATGLLVAVLAGIVARSTGLKEDASFAAFYLISLGLGVLLISLKGSNLDLLHVLFGTVLGLDDGHLVFIMCVSSVTLIALALMYRPLIIECLDPAFLKMEGGGGSLVHAGFLILLVVNLVAGYQVMGTLLVVGMMMLPAAAARFWGRTLGWQLVLAVSMGVLSSYAGLVLSYHFSLPASSAIILSAGALYILSLLFGPQHGLLRQPR